MKISFSILIPCRASQASKLASRTSLHRALALRALRGLAFLAAISAFPAHAILDTNANNLSDLWEKQHNNGNLFPNTFLATNDEDQDGWSNAKEAIAGTDPFQANPPDGIVPVEITPSLVPGAFTLTWPTIIGKNYQLKVSTDLVTWTNLGNPITTSQNTHTIGLNTTQPDNTIPEHVFWQVAVTDLDSDLDGLTNSEESALGTDSFLDDSDGDTLNDKAEILAHTNPLSIDSDLDGIPDNLDTTPLVNNVIVDPDLAGLSPALLNGLTSLWDFETLQSLTINGLPVPAYANLINPAQPAKYFGPLPSDDGLISRSAQYQDATHSLIAPPQVFSGKTNWSIAFWYKIAQGSIQNKAGTLNTVFWAYNNGNGSNNNDTTPEFQVHAYKALTPTASQKLIISHYHNGTLQPDLVTDIPQSNPLDNDTWQHLTITKQNGTIKLYRNAVLLNQFSTSAASYTATSTGYFALGRLHQSTTADTALRGKIDRFTIHNRALSATEVTAIVDLDSDKDGLYDRVETGTKLWRDANSNGIADPGETTYQNDPFKAQSNTRDTDGDGLTDIQEQTLGTGISKPDSDGDLMPDGWEIANGLNPLSAADSALDNDTGGPDGLTNLDEYRHNSDPKKRDTDSDGILDGPEAKGPDGNLATDDGSNPNDASDNGIRPPASELMTLKLGVGDRSGSHSEDYVLNVFQLQPDGSEKRIYTLRSGGSGQYTEQNRAFPKSHSYTFQIDWQATNNNAQSPGTANAEGTDFDYHLVVEPLSGHQSHILIDSYDPRSKTADPAHPLCDPQDINPADDDDDDAENFLETHEPKRVVVLHIPIQSRDRLIEGNMNDCQLLFNSYELSFSTLAENLGNYAFGSGNTSALIYSSINAIFSDDELAMVNSPNPNTSDPRIADQTIFYRDEQVPIQVKWFTALNTLSEFNITLSHNGIALGQSKHTPTAESNFSGLMDHLALRTSSADMLALASITEPSTEIGYGDEEEAPPELLPLPPAPIPAPAPPAAPVMTGTSRNLWAKVCFISNYAWEKTKHETVKNLKIGGGFIKGLSDGLCDGFKYDVEGVQELGLMIGESLQGNHARAKQLWDGVKLLATMPSAQRAVMYDNMLQSFIDKAQTQVPWDASANNVTDDWGVAAYMSGYGGGFIVEQVIMIYVTAGVGKGLMWLGNGVKNAIAATRAGVIIGQAISATQKFVVGAFLSVTKHVLNLGEEGIRSAQAIMRHLAQKTYLGQKAADITHEVIERLTPVKMTYQLFADSVAPHCSTVAKWMQYGYGCYKRMCEICTIGRLVLNESAMRGFACLYPALRSPTNASADFAEHLLNACRPTATAPVDPVKLNGLLEICDDTTVGYKFLPDTTDITKIKNPAPGGLVYNHGSQQGHRFIHVLEHCKENPLRAAAGKPHGVFDTPVEQLHTYLDDVWRNRGNYVVTTQNQGTKKVVEVTLPNNVGKADNIAGSSARSANGYVNTKTIKFVVTEDNNVYTLVTAYPITIIP